MAAKKKVLIIAGHGEGDPGACSKWGQEADYARELATLISKSIGTKLSVAMYDQGKNCYTQSKKGNVPDYKAYDYILEVHFNAKTVKDPNGDGKFTGVGGYYHPSNAGNAISNAVVDAIAALGFKVWLKATSTGLLNLNNAQKAGAKYFLLETAFIDDGDDMSWYTANKAAVAKAIAQTLITKLGANGSASNVMIEEENLYRVRKTWKDTASQLFAGTLEGAKRACIYGYSVFNKSGKAVYKNETKGTQAAEFKDMSETQFIEAIGARYTEDEKTSGILACVSLAQAILESGYAKTDLAQAANNLHGMKCSLSGNTWAGTTWDGSSYYRKSSPEQDGSGKQTMVESDFRKYNCIEESIADHAAYLLNAAKEGKQRYAGLAGTKDYKKALQIIKDGGYATDVDYVKKTCNIVEKWDLTRFNVGSEATGSDKESDVKEETTKDTTKNTANELYKVKTTCDALYIRAGAGTSFKVSGEIREKAGQKKEYTIIAEKNGWGELKSGAGWICLKYTAKVGEAVAAYKVKTTCDVLNIRAGAGTSFSVTGSIRETVGQKKEYTIIAEKNGWGELKSGAGWICLKYTAKIS